MQYKLTGDGAIEIMPYKCNENATPFAIAHPSPRATIAIENNVIYSPCIATEVGGKETKQVDSEI